MAYEADWGAGVGHWGQGIVGGVATAKLLLSLSREGRLCLYVGRWAMDSLVVVDLASRSFQVMDLDYTQLVHKRKLLTAPSGLPCPWLTR